MEKFVLGLIGLLSIVGCGGGDDANEARGETPAESALTQTECQAEDQALYFHGMGGYGTELGRAGICMPDISKSGGFWSNVAFRSASGAKVAAGYSAGRIPLVRRLARAQSTETTVIMLDPAYPDGARFEGRTGPDIVTEWLEKDESRRFILAYSPTSTGWSEYAELTTSAVGARVHVCSVKGEHLKLPGIVTAKLMTDTDAWLAERCRK